MIKEEKKSLEKNIWKLYAMNLFGNAQFHLVIFTLFFLAKGLGMKEFFVLASVGAVVALLMEIPTGSFSDRISRKGSIIIGTLFLIPSTILMIVSDSFPVLLIAFIIGGVTMAFYSGTDTALLYDTLKALKREKEFKRVNGKYMFLGMISVAIAGIIGGLVAQINLVYAWWLWFFMAFPMLFFQILLREPPFERKTEESYLLHLGESFKKSFRGEATYFIFYSTIIWIFFGVGFWLWQPYFKLIGLSVLYFGFIYAGLNLISGLTSAKAHKIEKRVGMKNSLFLIPLIVAVGFILQSRIIFVFGFLFLILQSLAGGYFSPVLQDYINSRIPSSKRATILSIKNMLGNLIFLIFSPFIGWIVDIYSLTTALFIMGILLFIIAVIFFMIFKNGREKK